MDDTSSNSTPTWRTRISAALLALATFVGAVGGYVLSDLVNFRSDYRGIVKDSYSEAQKAAQEVFQTLQTFSDKAVGESEVGATDRDKLREQVSILLFAAQDVARRVPEVGPEVQVYGEAMVDMTRAAETMTGPADAKEFVVATNRFLVAQKEFDEKFVETQASLGKALLPWR